MLFACLLPLCAFGQRDTFFAQNLTAQVSGDYVVLTWTQGTASDLVSNNVYRSSQSGGPYSEIYESTSPITTYTDYGCSGHCFYVVTTVGFSCCQASALDGAIATGSAQLTSAVTCPFSVGMVGAGIWVQNAGGTSGSPAVLISSIQSFANSCSVTLASAATNGLSATNNTSSDTVATDGAMANGSANLTSGSCLFNPRMVGYPIYVGGINLQSTVVTYIGSCELLLANSASSAVSGATVLLEGLAVQVTGGFQESGYSSQAAAYVAP